MNKLIPLSSIATLKTGPFGTQFSANEYVESGIPVINVRNIGYGEIITDDLEYVNEETRERLSEHILKTGDIVFGRKGSVDRHAYIDDRYDGWVQGSDCIRVRCSSEVNTRYLSHFLKLEFVKNQINNAAVGSTMASLNTDILGRVRIALPCREIQDRIERVLSAIEEKIENNSLISIQLESMAKALYDYWFVQFDFPDANGKPYRASGGEMVWNEQLKREIPKKWDVGMVDNLGSIVSGGTPTTTNEDYYTDNGIAWITPNDLSGNEQRMFVGHGERDISVEGLRNSSATLMPENSVLFSSRAPIGYIAISTNEICTNQGFKSIVPDKGYGAYYIYYTIKRNTPAIAKQGVGTTFKEVSGDTLKKFRICLPTKDIAEFFEKQVQAICERRRLLEQENTELSELRDWLLPMLMNGQATVAPAESAPKLQVLQPEKPARDPRFDRWLQTQGVAARGTVDEQILHDIFDAMDDDDKQ